MNIQYGEGIKMSLHEFGDFKNILYSVGGSLRKKIISPGRIQDDRHESGMVLNLAAFTSASSSTEEEEM